MSIKCKIFLGGTCNDSSWRKELKYYLDDLRIDYFDPVVDNWTPECVAIENEEKNNRCNIHLYVITSKMSGVYTIAEAVDSAWRTVPYLDEDEDEIRDIDRVVFIVLPNGFTESQLRSFKATGSLIKNISSESSIVKVEDISMKMVSELLKWLIYEINDEYEGK